MVMKLTRGSGITGNAGEGGQEVWVRARIAAPPPLMIIDLAEKG